MDSETLGFMPATVAAELIRTKKLSPVEYMRAILDRIEALEPKVNAFAHLNFENLKQDMAAGHGEYLASLGSLMGIAPARQDEFGALTQAHYTALIRSGQTMPAEMLVALNQLLAPQSN